MTNLRRIELSDVIANCHATLKWQSPSPDGEMYVCTNPAADSCRYQGETIMFDGDVYIRCLHDRHLGITEQQQFPFETKSRYAAERAGHEVIEVTRPQRPVTVDYLFRRDK